MPSHRFFVFITILKESVKLFGRNKKLMASVTILSMIASSIFSLIFFASFTTHDMVVKESMIPILSTVISKFISDATGITYLTPPHGFLPLYFIVMFLSMISTITVSSYSCNGDSLSLKELSSSIVKSWTRPFVTASYTTISVVGYESLTIYLAIPLLTSSLVSSNITTKVVAVVYGIVSVILYLYLSGIWILSLVVSVVDEEGGGISALGKSAEMMKGRKIDALLLNVFFNLVYFIVAIGGAVMMEGGDDRKVWGVLVVNFACLIRVLTFVAYTVLYFRGKEGVDFEPLEVELHGAGSDVDYAKLDLTPSV